MGVSSMVVVLLRDLRTLVTPAARVLWTAPDRGASRTFGSAVGLLIRCFYGGSWPPSHHGLQRPMRHVPFQAPRIAPYFSTASMK